MPAEKPLVESMAMMMERGCRAGTKAVNGEFQCAACRTQAECLAAAAAETAPVGPQPERAWIPLAERSPWWDGTYRVWRPDGGERRADWSNKGWRDPTTNEGLGLFTHWMPMPEQDARIADLERQLAETVEHAMKVDAENEKLKAEPAAKTRDAALARLERQDKEIEELRKIIARQTATIATVSEEKRAVEKDRDEAYANVRKANANMEQAERTLYLQLTDVEAQRDALAAGLRDALPFVEAFCVHGPDGDEPIGTVKVDLPRVGRQYAVLAAPGVLDRLRALAESFHPNAQAPVTTGESAPGIVSSVATEIPVATARPTRWQCGECEKYVESAVFCPCPHCGAFAEPEATREKCGACGGSGTYTEEHDHGASETLGCQDCRGTGNADGLP